MRLMKNFEKNWRSLKALSVLKTLSFNGGFATDRLGFQFELGRISMWDNEYISYQFTIWFLCLGFDLSYEKAME